jgi:hypothetical protein
LKYTSAPKLTTTAEAEAVAASIVGKGFVSGCGSGDGVRVGSVDGDNVVEGIGEAVADGEGDGVGEGVGNVEGGTAGEMLLTQSGNATVVRLKGVIRG